MNTSAIGALVWRYLFVFARPSWFVAMPLRSAIDLLAFGLLGLVALHNMPEAITSLLATIVVWQAAMRINESMSFMFVNELFDANLTALFISPLSLYEWMCAGFLVSVVIGACVVLFGWLTALLLGINVFVLWLPIVLASFCFIVFGCWLGLFSCALLTMYGRSYLATTFIVAWIFMPLSGVYFPVTVLPAWVQSVAYALPLVYISDYLRTCFTTGCGNIILLAPAMYLNITWFLIALFVFVWTFRKSKQRGLVRLESAG